MKCLILSIFTIGACTIFLSSCNSEADATDGNPPPDSAQLDPIEKINLNSATAEELETLPGVGDVMAQRIIEGRPFEKVEDILRIDGLGEGTLEKVKDLVTTN